MDILKQKSNNVYIIFFAHSIRELEQWILCDAQIV